LATGSVTCTGNGYEPTVVLPPAALSVCGGVGSVLVSLATDQGPPPALDGLADPSGRGCSVGPPPRVSHASRDPADPLFSAVVARHADQSMLRVTGGRQRPAGWSGRRQTGQIGNLVRSRREPPHTSDPCQLIGRGRRRKNKLVSSAATRTHKQDTSALPPSVKAPPMLPVGNALFFSTLPCHVAVLGRGTPVALCRSRKKLTEPAGDLASGGAVAPPSDASTRAAPKGPPTAVAVLGVGTEWQARRRPFKRVARGGVAELSADVNASCAAPP